VLPLVGGQRAVFGQRVDQPPGQFRVDLVAAACQVLLGLHAGQCRELLALVAEADAEDLAHGLGQPVVQRDLLFGECFSRGSQRFGKRLAANVEFLKPLFIRQNLFLHSFAMLRQCLVRVAVKLGDLLRRQRFSIDPQIVHGALKALAAVARADAPWRRAPGGNAAGSLERADLPAVEVNPHHLPVERGGAVMPIAVEQAGRLDRCVAFDVAAHVQPQRENRAVALEREQHAVVAVLFAKDLVVTVEPHRQRPCAEGNLFDAADVGHRRHADVVLLGKLHRVAEEPVGAAEHGRACGRRIVAATARIAALAAGVFVERPVGDQGLVGGAGQVLSGRQTCRRSGDDH